MLSTRRRQDMFRRVFEFPSGPADYRQTPGIVRFTAAGSGTVLVISRGMGPPIAGKGLEPGSGISRLLLSLFATGGR